MSTIKKKKKKCKANGPAKGFDGCGDLKYIHRYGLCEHCFKVWLLTTPEGEIVLQKSSLKGKKKVEKEKKEELKALKKVFEPVKSKLQKKVQLIARLIDKGELCLARNIRGQMHGGHVISRGSNSQMSFNLHNIHRQSASSNKWQNDDGLLKEGVVYEYGQDYMDFISSLKRTPLVKYSDSEYREFYAVASKIALELKASNLRYSKEDRIRLRNEINLKLGIYGAEFCVFKY
jgi:hypothetical protein